MMKKSTGIFAAAAGLALLLSGCSAIPVQPQAEKVIVAQNPPPAGCKFLGQIVGNQGNFFTGGFTSNANLSEGAMNDMRNQAGNMGANYIQLTTNNAASTGGFSSDGMGGMNGSMQETNVANTGNAYNCPPASIGE